MAALRFSPAATLRPSVAVRSSVAAVRSSLSTSLLPNIRLSPRLRLRRRGGVRMMETAASSYASALASVAQSNGTLDSTVTDVEKVDAVFADPAVQSFFANPTISDEKKRQVIDDIVKSSSLQSHIGNFLNILVDNRRIDIVRDIAKEFEKAYNSITGTEVAVVSSVVSLEPSDLAQIAQAVQRLTGAKNVRIKTAIDPALIAGFTVRYGSSGSKLIDLSVKKQINDIAAQLQLPDTTLVS